METMNGQPPHPLSNHLDGVYRRLLTTYGPQGWWPGAHDPWEVIVGAILTQNTAWVNVERALANLKTADSLSPQRIRALPHEELGALLRPSGYFNGKTKKLKAFAGHLGERYGDDLGAFLGQDLAVLRPELLSIYGIGEETADDILVYAANTPSFVIDAYTRRILERLGSGPVRTSYAGYQALFHDSLPADAGLFNEYHALLVRHAKDACRKTPVCEDCCLRDLCAYGQA